MAMRGDGGLPRSVVDQANRTLARIPTAAPEVRLAAARGLARLDALDLADMLGLHREAARVQADQAQAAHTLLATLRSPTNSHAAR